jgi:CRISPR-associated protein (TIGR03986 family)
MNPKHIDEVPEFIKDDKGKDIPRRAVAPYNFVELPDKVVEAEQPLPEGDRYHPNKDKEVALPRHTGRIECTLTTKSQLYTRCGWSPEDFAEHGEKAFKDLPDDIKHKRANFFINPATQKPIVPGSSIRGMLRTLVEIVSFGKIDRVTENKLFYRSLGDPALKYIYQANFVDNLGDVQHSPNPKAPCYHSKVHAGFLCKRNNSYVIEECGYGRIDRHSNKRVIPNLPNQPNLPTKPIYQGTGPGKVPSWTYQHHTVYVAIDRSEQDYFFPKQTNRNGGKRHPDLYLRLRKVHSASFTPAPELQKGTLVITGDMQHKHLEFVFLEENLKEYPVSEEMVRRFQDDDQITKWQKDAYSKDKPSRACRQQDGYLRDGEPVFFLLNDDEKTVRFFGRAQMFRLPYEHSPLDFVPPKLRDASHTDIAEAIFGYVNGKKPREKTCAGRVFISDGTLNPNQEERVKPSLDKNPERILLSSPKPTTFQHYLVQQDVTQDNLKHYASKPPTDTEAGEAVIRGHKLYWHKPCKIEVPENSDTQTSLVKPIEPEIEFTFKVYFENLTNVELGALLWILDKAEKPKSCLSLGMGKPLGMGTVKVKIDKLWFGDRTQRYSSLFSNNNQWELGETDNTDSHRQNCIEAFEQYILSHIDDIDRAGATTLDDVRRIKMLLEMLRCDRTSEANQIEYMKLDEFRNRKVLPTPLPPQPKNKVQPPKKKPSQSQSKSGVTNKLAMERVKKSKS